MLNIILIGPQGSGKGTQADKIIEEFKLTQIEAGALIRTRAEKHDRKGEIIDHLANKKGQLLPDGIVLSMIMDELEEKKTKSGYLFDGFPRSQKQYVALKAILAERKMQLTVAIYLSISDEETMRRLLARRSCDKCHKSFSLLVEPQREYCECGGKLIKRKDDEPTAIRQRLRAFAESTEPVLKMIREDGILGEVNGGQSVEKIFSEIRSIIKDKERSTYG